MPTTVVHDGKFRKLLFDTPVRHKIQIRIESNVPVNVYIVQESELDEWRNGEGYEGFAFQQQRRIKADLTLPRDYDDEWYLIIRNDAGRDAAIKYDVYDL